MPVCGHCAKHRTVPRYRADVLSFGAYKFRAGALAGAILPQFSCTRGIDSSSSAAEVDADVSLCYIPKRSVVTYSMAQTSIQFFHSVLDRFSSVLEFNQCSLLFFFLLRRTAVCICNR